MRQELGDLSKEFVDANVTRDHGNDPADVEDH